MLKTIADEAIARTRDNFREAAMVYTDGSLNPDTGRAGANYYLLEEASHRHIRVSDFVSTLDTELATILQAFAHLEHRSWVVVTDSLNAAWKIKDHRAKNSLVTLIQQQVQTRHENGLDTVVVWVPLHVRLRGNDAADSAALEGARLPEIGLVNGPSLSRLKAASAKATLSLRVATLTHDRVRNPYSISWCWNKNVRRLLPAPGSLPASVQVVLTRFRTSYRRHIDCPELQRCPCNQRPFHVAHILASCTAMD